MEKEWYVLEYERKDYLHNKRIFFQRYSGTNGNHRHCELCWNRFSGDAKDLQAGYYEPNSKSWICNDCYENYGKLFGWVAINSIE